MKRFFTPKWLGVVAVLAIFGVACGGGDATATPSQPTATTAPTGNSAPTADFTWDPPAVPRGDNYQTVFTFTATASDPDGDTLTYEWQFTGGRPPTATGQVVTTTFPGVAPYGVTLTVSDGKGGETTVNNTVPLTSGAPTPSPPAATPSASLTPGPGGKYTWEFFELEQGAKPALALNSEGKPGIAFLREDMDHGFVKYAKWVDEDAWNPEGFDILEVADGYFYGPLDMAFDPDDRPHITWHDHQNPSMFLPTLGDAVHAVKADPGWNIEAVFSEGHDGWDNSITIDQQGFVHMTAVDPLQFQSTEGIEYYSFDGNEWTVEQIGSVPTKYAFGNSLVVDAQGRPHVTYHDSESKDLYYAFRGDQGWVIEAIDSDGDVGKFSSLALDSQGLPLVSYLELTGSVNGPSTGNIKLARARTFPPASADWDIETVDSLDNLFMGFLGARLITSLVLDPDGNPIISYSDQGVIKLAAFDGQQWNIETVATAGDLPFGQLLSLAIGPDGVLHLAFTDAVERQSPGIVGTVTYARGTPVQ